ncbi:MAG TPA: glycosyltransferase family 39 protein [Candidatus Solibacter sp.]|nr:glycosyltransferase family 39 protein [Candidatus Solibacter sp.]
MPANSQPLDRTTAVDTWPLLGIAAAVALVHIITNGRYGFHRDELQFLSDARHLDWGFVCYPPFTPFVERISMSLFGQSLIGLRLFSVIAQAIAIVVTGLMARELGGGRLAQIIAALAIALSPLPMFEGTEFQYTTFDYLWWTLIAYVVIRLLKSDDPRWWLAIGAAIGIGLQSKYTMAFYTCGIVGGVVLTRARRYLLNPWLWAGVAISLLVFLPNLLWQFKHDFISLKFLQHIHTRDVGEGRSQGFVSQQFWLCANLIAAPLWLAGLIGYLRDRRYRMLAWMYIIPFALYIAGKGRSYYHAGAYPMLMAMGTAVGERWVSKMSTIPRRVITAIFVTGVVGCGIVFSCVLIPWATSGPLRAFALKNNGDLREEIGWDELVKNVAAVRDSLPPEQQSNYGVLVGNYGEQGAIEILGPAYHLPPPISGTNSAWLRGYPDPPPATLIVIGHGQDYVNRMFTACRWAGHNGNSEGIHNEESESHPDIFVCGAPRQPWPQFWKEYQAFG